MSPCSPAERIESGIIPQRIRAAREREADLRFRTGYGDADERKRAPEPEPFFAMPFALVFGGYSFPTRMNAMTRE